MRRFASVFSKRDKNEKPPKRTDLNVRTQDIATFDSSLSTPQLSAGGSEPANSSSSSAGSVSLSLRTPEEMPISLVNTKKTWIPWLAKKSGTTKAYNRPTWTPQPPPLLLNPPPGPRVPISTNDQQDSDSESDAYGEDDDFRPTNSILEKPIVTPVSLSKSRSVLKALTQNSLNDRPCSAPFVVQPGAPLYPRSCNRSRSLPNRNSLASTVLKSRILKRLEDANLLSSEAESIITFSTRNIPPIASTTLDMIDDKALSTPDRTASFSIGLRSWIARPPFEDRSSVWSAVDGKITCQRISNTPGFALAALEFSEAIEAEADIYGDRMPLQPAVDLQVPSRSASMSDIPSSSSSSSSHMSSSASHTRSIPSPQLLAPSPLRNQASTLSASTSSDGRQKDQAPLKDSSPVSPVSSTPVLSSALSNGTIKRGVRFIEEEKDENIPIGYVMRVKKQREEKARFLREQKERRQFEVERARIDEERKQREQERRKWEQERQAWEKERRAMEEERKRKQYAEEVVAARQRAESSRMGMRASSSSLRESERNPAASKRLSRGSETPPSLGRMLSEPYPRDHSPADSRSPSIASGGQYSRPSSIHSSSEDVRSGRPQSAAFFIPPVPPIPQFYPYQSAYPLDLPLLPPTAPFMVNNYSRRQSLSPRSSSRQRMPSDSSAESVNRNSVHSRQGSSPREPTTLSPSPSSSPHRTHQRRISDDNARRLSTLSSSSPRSSSTSHLPHGRSTNPVQSQQTLPSPWTAPPTLNGGIPTSMPRSSSYGGGTVTRHTPSRRQSTFS